MIEIKALYQSADGSLKMQILSDSSIHNEFYLVGIMVGSKKQLVCHVHKQEIIDNWTKVTHT
jgi:hypothetical protein